MKQIYIISIIAAFFALNVTAQENAELEKKAKNGKYGFVDKTGKEIIPCIYEDADVFGEGLAPVKLNGQWGLIDKTGNIATPFKYRGISRCKENPSFYYCYTGDDPQYWKNGLLDKTGKEVIPCIYSSLWFCNGNKELLFVCVGIEYSDKRIGIVNLEGKEIIPPIYIYYYGIKFVDGLAVGTRNSAGGIYRDLIDVTGKIIDVQTVSIMEAADKNLIKLVSFGNTIKSSYLNIENLTDKPLRLTIPAGTFLAPEYKGTQNMLIWLLEEIIVRPGEKLSESVATACMNLYKGIPTGKTSFTIKSNPEKKLLIKLVKLINQKSGNEPVYYEMVQAAVWIITDKATYEEVQRLRESSSGFSNWQVISKNAYDEAVELVKQAKKMK